MSNAEVEPGRRARANENSAGGSRVETRREFLAGICMVIGLCWPYLFSSVLPSVHWWMFLPFAIGAGIIRQRPGSRRWGALLPLYGFCMVILLFTAIAAALNPLSDYGQEKVINFAILAGAALIAASRQAPITESLVAGMRAALPVTFLLGVGVAIINRDIFLNADRYGVEVLTQSFSVTGFPLAIAMAASFALPRTLAPKWLIAGAAALLVAVAVEIFIRGRFNAALLAVMAVMLVVGPPWKNIFWRVVASGVLVVIALALFVNVLPLFGDSFRYLEDMHVESMGGRTPMYREALNGFLEHPLGQGIGSFQLVEPSERYPHNIVLEVAYEMGVLGLAAVLGIYLVVMRRGWELWKSPPHRVLAALLLMPFAQMLKAGDISTIAFHWVYLYLLVVGTPLAASWSLQRGRDLR